MYAKNNHALMQRINRRLDGLRVRVCRHDSREFLSLGRYYITDSNKLLRHPDVDLNQLAKELGMT
jgi:hypothetical protein